MQPGKGGARRQVLGSGVKVKRSQVKGKLLKGDIDEGIGDQTAEGDPGKKKHTTGEG